MEIANTPANKARMIANRLSRRIVEKLVLPAIAKTIVRLVPGRSPMVLDLEIDFKKGISLTVVVKDVLSKNRQSLPDNKRVRKKTLSEKPSGRRS